MSSVRQTCHFVESNFYSGIKYFLNFKLSPCSSYLPTYEDGTQCSKTLAYKIQTLGNHPEESIQQKNIFISKVSNKNVPCSQTTIPMRHQPHAFSHYLFRCMSPISPNPNGRLLIHLILMTCLYLVSSFWSKFTDRSVKSSTQHQHSPSYLQPLPVEVSIPT
jgi:hypothetical protein